MDIGSRRGMSAGDGPGCVCPCPAGRAAAGRPGAACRADADCRPVGIHRPRGRRRQGRAARPGQGLPRAAQVQRRRRGEEGRGRLHHRAGDLPGRRRPEDRPARCRQGRPHQRRSPAAARRRAPAHQHRHRGGPRPAAERAAPGQGAARRRQGAAARRRDPALLHRDQVADRRAHRPRRGLAGQPRQSRLRRARHGGERDTRSACCSR